MLYAMRGEKDWNTVNNIYGPFLQVIKPSLIKSLYTFIWTKIFDFLLSLACQDFGTAIFPIFFDKLGIFRIGNDILEETCSIVSFTILFKYGLSVLNLIGFDDHLLLIFEKQTLYLFYFCIFWTWNETLSHFYTTILRPLLKLHRPTKNDLI